MDWLEVLIPIIIIAVYFLSGLRGKGDADQEPGVDPNSPEGQAAAAERERIQEEIRQRILERRREAEDAFNRKAEEAKNGGAAVVPPPVPQPARTQAREMRRPTNIPQAPARPEMPERPQGPEFSWSDSGNPFAKELAQKRKQIADTQRRADELRKQHGSGPAKSAYSNRTSRNERPRGQSRYSSGSVRDTLLTPGAARNAIILQEVMGKPVSMRESNGERVA